MRCVTSPDMDHTSPQPSPSRRGGLLGLIHPPRLFPPTRNLDSPSVGAAIDIVPREAKRVDTVPSNSFGFGGTIANTVMRRVE